MSTENVLKFHEAAATSPDLQARLQAIYAGLARQRAEKVAELSVETGLPFTAEEFLASARPSESELSDEQLNSVAGGTDETTFITRRGPVCNWA